MIGDMRVKVGPVSVETADGSLAPGVILAERARVLVGTGSDPVRLTHVQPPGKNLMAAADWARGARLDAGVRAS